MDDLKEKYDILQTELKLPDFDTLDNYFDISSLDESVFLLRSVRKKMCEKIDYFCNILDDIIHPESSFASLRESGIFSDKEKDGILESFKKLMYFSRLSIELNVKDDEQTNAVFINNFMQEYPDLQKKLIDIIIKLKESWKSAIDKKEIVGYFG